jgi:ribosome maturation factor RimP
LDDISALTTIVEPEANALGFALVRVALFGSGEERTLQVMAERPETRQLTIDDCAALSRRISDRLDEAEAEGRDPIEGAYRLEVSSPGIDRPLTRLADFAEWSGHEAKVQLANRVATSAGDRKSLHGALAGVEVGTIALDDRKSGPVRFRLEDVASAKLVLTDRLIAATRPLDTSGVEEQDLGEGDEDEDHIEDELLSKEQDA